MTAQLLHRLVPVLALGLNLLLLGTALSPDRKSPRSRLFACLATALAVWDVGVLGLRWAEQPGMALVWERVIHLGVIPLPVLFYHYVLAFLEAPRRRPSLVLGYLGCGGFLAVSNTPFFIAGVKGTPWGYAPVTGPAYPLFLLFFHAYMGWGLGWLVRAYRQQDSSFRRNRILLVIIGVLVSIAGGAVDFFRFILSWEWLYPAGIPSNAVFALALGVAIVRYRLMDISALAKRSVLYALTAAALAPVLFLGLHFIDLLTPDQLTPGDRLSGDVRYPLMLLVAFTLALPLLRKLTTQLDRLMFQRRHGVRDALVALSKEMAAVLDAHALGAALTEGLVTRVPVTHAALYLGEGDPVFARAASAASAAADATGPPAIEPALALWLQMTRRTLVAEEIAFHALADASVRAAVAALEASRVALLVPLVLEGELTGILAVGEKLSGEIFDLDEIELLETLVGETAVALKNARLYEDLRRQMQELRLAQEQVLQSAKLAAIGELAASVAHEINNPLTVVLGQTGMLLREVEPRSPAHQRLVMIEAEVNRMGKITRDLLDFSRRRQSAPEPVQLEPLLERALMLTQGKLTRARAEVETLFAPDLPLVIADADQLLQVFLNLISNAVDSMPNGGRLVLRAEGRQGGQGSAVAISVSDTGVGMTPEQAARIFEPFYTTKPDGQGTGLGLAVALNIVRKHGGTIDVHSTPGTGTTMTVCLPIHGAVEADTPGVSGSRG